MEYRGPGRRTLAVALALVIVLSLVGVGTSHAASRSNLVTEATGTSLAVTASSGFKFNPSLIGNAAASTAVANVSIVLTFTNGDNQAHTFTLSSRQGFVIPDTDSEDQLNSFLVAYPPLFNVQANGSSQVIANFTAPVGPGWYEFVCIEAGHFQEGMYGFIAFGEALPSNLTVSLASTGPGAAVFIIVGTVVSLTVIAIVLGFVVGRRKGAMHDMPPERLGYPEPKLPSEPAPPPASPPKGR